MNKNISTNSCCVLLFLITNNSRGISQMYQSDKDDLVYNQNHLYNFGESDYIIFEEKIPTVEVYVPHKIPQGLEVLIISRIANNMCYLNPHLRDIKLRDYLNHLNSLCEEQLSQRIINKIYSELERNSKLGLIEPIYTKQRKVVFRNDCPSEIRNNIKAIASGKVRSEKNYGLIDEALNDWDLYKGKITNKSLAEFAGVHNNTLKKYFKNHPELKDKKLEINKVILNK
jgi:hypothetical protein